MKQTAVEWLVNVVQSCIAPDYIPKEIVEQAKEMEKIEKNKMCDIMQEFAAFCVKCDREKLPLLFAKEWIEQFKKK